MSASSVVNQRENLRPNQVEENKENIQLIWLDANINHSDDCQRTKNMLLELNPAAQFYTESDRCFDLIKSIKYEQIFVIVSGALVRHLLSKVHHHRPLVAIFIFCSNRQHHQALIDEYDKIIGIYTDQKTLLEAIRQKMHLIEKQTLAFNLFDQKQKSIKDLSKESASFLWYQMLVYVLRQIPQDQQSKQQMIQLAQEYYQNNKKELKKIERFQNSYRSDQAIQWYTDEGFLYKLLNKALRTENIDLLYTFRFFIIDLCAAIENRSKSMKKTKGLKLYRGTQIPKEETEKLKENIGKIISTNGFLSTSKNQSVSVGFAKSNQINKDFQSVLFVIEVDPTTKSITFADIENESVIKGEEEVLFNLNTTFRIESVRFDKTLQLWKIQLKTTDEGSEKVQEYFQLANQEMEEYSPTIYFGRLLLNDLGQVDQAKKYFEMLLKALPSDHPEIGSIYNNLGAVYDDKGDLTLALKNYERGYEIRRKTLPPHHPQIAGSLNNIGLIHSRKRNDDLALDYHQRSLKIKETNYPNDHLQKAMTLQNIGSVYIDKNDFEMAYDYLSRALQMYKQVLPNQHSSIASCLGSLGEMYEEKDDLEVALDYYHQQLNMEEQCFPFDHPHLSYTLDSIVDGYEQMGEIEQGLQFCREKLAEQKNRLGENHVCLARTLRIMGSGIASDDSNRSLEYYQQALSILENCTPSDHQLTALCLKEMATVYGDLDMLEDALRCYFKALDLSRQILSSDHTEIAHILELIAAVHEDMNNRSEALRYFNESLSIYRLNFEPAHDTVRELEADIARVNTSCPSRTSFYLRMRNLKSLTKKVKRYGHILWQDLRSHK